MITKRQWEKDCSKVNGHTLTTYFHVKSKMAYLLWAQHGRQEQYGANNTTETWDGQPMSMLVL
jgi:hypothetical protein